ncbi:unnamed protein product [Calypogeia fissa]
MTPRIFPRLQVHLCNYILGKEVDWEEVGGPREKQTLHFVLNSKALIAHKDELHLLKDYESFRQLFSFNTCIFVSV